MALGKRLLALYHLVPKGSVVADVGCDHGQLSIALIQKHIAKHVYACDLRSGPLSRAKQAVELAGLGNAIDCRLRNGLDDLPDDVDTIVIAGMGIETIQMILESHFEELTKQRIFIIQSNTHPDALRKWISDHHFTILKEDLVQEDRHFYEIVSFSPTFHASYSADEILFGIFLPEHALFHSYWKKCLCSYQSILDGLSKDHEAFDHFQSMIECIENKLS